MAGSVLIVDDNEHNREYARQALAGRWVTTVVAGGQEALDALAATPPSLVLLDLSMPVIDGWEVLRRVQLDPEWSSIPMVACSAHAMAGDRERGLAAGFAAYLAKPYRAPDLVACVASFLGAAEPDSVASDDDWGTDELSFSEEEWDSAQGEL